jgi:Protein of unknown function (DUF2442)
MEGAKPMKTDHFTITQLQIVKPMCMEMRFADDTRLTVDITPLAKKHKSLSPLSDWTIFKTAKIQDAGRTVQWSGSDELELASDNLRARAIEQTGQYSHEWLWNWMHKHQLTLDVAARSLGISRRMLAYYKSGAKPLPLTVVLACIGLESRNFEIEKLAA